MKNITLCAIVLVAMFGVMALAFAGSDTTGDITVTANVPTNTLLLSWGMSRVDAFVSADGSNPAAWQSATIMDFGTLTHTLQTAKPAACGGDREAGVWYSQYFYPIIFSVITTSGRQYTVTSTSTGLTSGGTKLPKAWGVVSDCYDITGKKFVACPEGTSLGLGNGMPAEGTVTLYTSAARPSQSVGVRADYSISGYANPSSGCTETKPFASWVPVPLTQAGGTYSGTVKITVTD